MVLGKFFQLIKIFLGKSSLTHKYLTKSKRFSLGMNALAYFSGSSVMNKTSCLTLTSGARGLNQVVALALVEEQLVPGNRLE